MVDFTESSIKIERANVTEGEFVRFISEHEPSGTILIYDYQDSKLSNLIKTANFLRDDNEKYIQNAKGEFIAEFDTSGLAAGNYRATYPRGIDDNGDSVKFHVRAASVGNTDVTLHRTESYPTDDQALWTTIRNSTTAICFDRYRRFVDLVFHGHQVSADPARFSFNVYGPSSYPLLKWATQAFLTLQCGLRQLTTPPYARLENDPDFFKKDKLLNLKEEARRMGRPLVGINELKGQLEQYIGNNGILPYLDRIISAMLAVGPDDKTNVEDESQVLFYHDVLKHRATQPSLIELIWSYWLEEGMLAQTMNAIALRFQNQRSGPNDPLAELEIDPLRPLNNMIWGFVQDRYNQLSVSRRAAEYDHQYGLRLVGRAVPELQSADSRSKFIETFHNLLYRTSIFYREDADTTVIADAFPLLNALKDVHLLLAEGAHNQYGDLPWTARTEMLSQQWMLARPEMREFLRGRHMVPYQEDWMGAVDAMKKLQGWTDTTISHFHELAVDGERVLLSIRFGNWSDLNLSDDNARNWARYWKPEIQRYLYGYMAVTGVDLMNEVTDTREAEVRYLQPSALLQRRLAGQSRQPAALAAAPRRPAIAAPAGQGYAALPRPQQSSRISRMRAIKYEQGE
jgi:hypothetical protein